MLSLYLAMLYTDKPYYDVARIRCMCKQLHDLQQRNRLKQTGLLRRYGATCYGKQETLDDIKAGKAEKYQQLKRSDPEYEEWFLKYSPMEHFEHTYNPKKHKLTVKRSPNAKKGSPSPARGSPSPARGSTKSTSRSTKSTSRSPYYTNNEKTIKAPAKKPKARSKTKKSKKTIMNKFFKLII